MIISVILLLNLFCIQGKINYPKRSIGLNKKQSSHQKNHRLSQISSISTLQLIEEPLIGQETTQFYKERLEFDTNLLLQQELIEEDETEFPKSNYTSFVPTTSIEHGDFNYKQEFQKAKQLLINLHYKEVLFGLFIVSFFLTFIWCIMKLCLITTTKYIKEDEEQKRLLGVDYSIMNSKTISEDEQEQKYKITDLTPQIRNPYDESFVKQSLKATTRGSVCDQSLLEIDELLQEMLQ